MGGHFYTCILNNLPWENIANHVSTSAYVCIADNRKDSVVEKSFDASHPKVLDLIATAETDSSSSSDEETDADEKLQTLADREENVSKDGNDSEADKDTREAWSKAQSELYKRVPLSIVEYSDMDCSLAEEVAVIVGGETEGVSVQAKKLAFERYGQFVTIPMVEAVDSLNTATAAAVVLYEARRQIIARIKSQQRQSARKRSGMSWLHDGISDSRSFVWWKKVTEEYNQSVSRNGRCLTDICHHKTLFSTIILVLLYKPLLIPNSWT